MGRLQLRNSKPHYRHYRNDSGSNRRGRQRQRTVNPRQPLRIRLERPNVTLRRLRAKVTRIMIRMGNNSSRRRISRPRRRNVPARNFAIIIKRGKGNSTNRRQRRSSDNRPKRDHRIRGTISHHNLSRKRNIKRAIYQKINLIND